MFGLSGVFGALDAFQKQRAAEELAARLESTWREELQRAYNEAGDIIDAEFEVIEDRPQIEAPR